MISGMARNKFPME